jgi:hypothetical protein
VPVIAETSFSGDRTGRVSQDEAKRNDAAGYVRRGLAPPTGTESAPSRPNAMVAQSRTFFHNAAATEAIPAALSLVRVKI